MEIVSRKEFIAIMEEDAPGLKPVTSRSPLWIPERELEPKTKCIKFIRTKRLHLKDLGKRDYWEWCNETLNGTVRCFSSGDEDEWWGFTDPDDVVIWTLRWAK
jgi:hypothetical protein